ncbi:vWA domain-containing protein [Lewinella sp. IMCC34191]|uniref:vWA domain-containing protein n=1 Tax=Lewinella sp. IMCC34191 TaxID=2259172 RepID=UPI000E265C48|nr:VWA domain-containing protein [Lewinella sp. IMCC34191]
MRFLPLLFLGLLTACSQDFSDSGAYSPQANYAGNDASGESVEPSGDQYGELVENDFVATAEEPVSTFSIDADGGSYANVRRFLQSDRALPPPGAVRIEEMVNYFDLDYPAPTSDIPIALNGEVADCPWNPDNRLVRIGIQGRDLGDAPPANYVFLVDVSGSMSSPDKIGLLKQGLYRFVDQMSDRDFLSIVTYAGWSGVTLPSTAGSDKVRIRRAIDKLSTGGSTNGAGGILAAYEEASRNFIEGGNNRIFLGTDGDFNVGITDHDELIELIEKKRESGVFFTALGVGRGNYNEHMLEQIANHGNGTYEYLDKSEELEKVFLHETGKFFTVAQDVKVQVAFNPDVVQSYRLIGYENRLLNQEDFEDDTKDAGEIGAGQNITALYEIVPAHKQDVQKAQAFTIDFRYKAPGATESVPLSLSVTDEGASFATASDQFRFVASVAAFGQLLRQSQYTRSLTYTAVQHWLNSANLPDPHGYKEELSDLIRLADPY